MEVPIRGGTLLSQVVKLWPLTSLFLHFAFNSQRNQTRCFLIANCLLNLSYMSLFTPIQNDVTRFR